VSVAGDATKLAVAHDLKGMRTFEVI